ncbi:MAG: hypothetical protein LBD48_12465 [Treponema sp.]|nr:hypothetical protein [Treponema sp.]
MGLYRRFMPPVLMIYESVRLGFLVRVLGALRLEGADSFPVTACITPIALFLLMTLFLCVDSSRYGVFMPLYTAGKSIGFVSALVWILFSGQNILYGIVFGNGGLFELTAVFVFLLAGELLAAAAGLVFMAGRSRKTAIQTAGGGE